MKNNKTNRYISYFGGLFIFLFISWIYLNNPFGLNRFKLNSDNTYMAKDSDGDFQSAFNVGGIITTSKDYKFVADQSSSTLGILGDTDINVTLGELSTMPKNANFNIILLSSAVYSGSSIMFSATGDDKFINNNSSNIEIRPDYNSINILRVRDEYNNPNWWINSNVGE